MCMYIYVCKMQHAKSIKCCNYIYLFKVVLLQLHDLPEISSLKRAKYASININ